MLFQSPSFTTEELIRTAAAESVSRVVLIQHSTFYLFDNSYMIDAARKYPGKFKIVGMVDDHQPHPDVRMRRLAKQHVTGFRITPWIRDKGQTKRRGAWLAHPGMAAMWKCGAETGQAMCCLIDPPDLPYVDRMCAK